MEKSGLTAAIGVTAKVGRFVGTTLGADIRTATRASLGPMAATFVTALQAVNLRFVLKKSALGVECKDPVTKGFALIRQGEYSFAWSCVLHRTFDPRIFAKIAAFPIFFGLNIRRA